MADEIATNPVAGADAPAPGVAADDAASAVQAETTDDAQATETAAEGDPGQAVEDDGEDIEHDGKQYRVPKELKDAFLRQSDYTQKTQTLAEQRRALESQQAQVQREATWNREHAQEIGQLVAIDAKLAQYQKVDWQAWTQQDPVAAQAAFIDYQQTRDARAGTVQSLQQRDAQRQAATEQQLQARLDEGRAQLAKAIPGWGPELQGKLSEFGKANGLQAHELENLVDPRLVRILHKAMIGEQILNSQRAAAKPPTAPPAKPVTVIGARPSPKPVVASSPQSDRLSTDEWMRRRNAEEAAQRGRR